MANEEVKALNDQEAEGAAGGIAGVVTAQPVYHLVQWGDTLSGIAQAYHTTVQAILALNPGKIKNVDHIEAGWKLRVI